MTKGIKGYNSKRDKPEFEGIITSIPTPPKVNKLAEFFKNLYLKAMLDLDWAGVINFHDRELIEWSVSSIIGDGKPFATFTALGGKFGFYPAEISNIRSGVRKMKSKRIRKMLNQFEKLKRGS